MDSTSPEPEERTETEHEAVSDVPEGSRRSSPPNGRRTARSRRPAAKPPRSADAASEGPAPDPEALGAGVAGAEVAGAEVAGPEVAGAAPADPSDAPAKPKRRRSARPTKAEEAQLALAVPPAPKVPDIAEIAGDEAQPEPRRPARKRAAPAEAAPASAPEPARRRDEPEPREARSERSRDRDDRTRERDDRTRDRDDRPRDRDDRTRDRDDRTRERDDRTRDRDDRTRDREEARDERPRDDKGPRPTIHRRAFPSEHLDEDALKVLRRLHRHGYKAYLVGGGVRDLLLHRKPKDFDVATSARPHEVKHLFRNCRIIGRRFRLAHILFQGGKVIETATFRRDPTAAADEDTFLADADAAYPGGSGDPRWREAIDSGEFDATTVLVPRSKSRDDDADLLIRNDNVFGEPHEDALRRDFTINGLFYDVERGEVIDYVGGLRDLERRAIDTIGLPDVRFREDPIRILRAIKFSARLDLGIDPDCYDAMVAQREELRKAAKPRLLEEILRLLRGGAAHRSMWLAWEIGVLTVVLPELAVFLDDDAPRSRLLWGRLDAIDASIRAGRVPSDSVLLAALLLGPVEEAIEGARDPASAYEELMHDVNESLAVPRRIKERVRAIIGSQRRLRAGRTGSLPRRDFFAEAVQLLELESAARGVRAPVLDAELPEGAVDGEVVVRRRRRRRPRR